MSDKHRDIIDLGPPSYFRTAPDAPLWPPIAAPEQRAARDRARGDSKRGWNEWEERGRHRMHPRDLAYLDKQMTGRTSRWRPHPG